MLVADKLFATLDTRTRRWEIPGWGEVLLSDPVGFFRDLPHHLVASFRSTLEETRRADLLLHVADAGHPRVADQIATVNGVWTMSEPANCPGPGAQQGRQVEDRTDIDILRAKTQHCVAISATSGLGLDRLSAAVCEMLGEGRWRWRSKPTSATVACWHSSTTRPDDRQRINEKTMRLIYRIPAFAEQIHGNGTTVTVR
ncbi:MAG: hypothetical protein Ct9H300mP1_29340 [Planctomycetaceae bacterium]|nr:MAG: hypothetical protein Ct9H300mP1_29340 [Planctomycetaceae bacterium]